MRLFINQSDYLSVIQTTRDDNIVYNCQVMTLVHGIGMHPATITSNAADVVACVVHTSPYYVTTSKIADTLSEVAEFHEWLVKQYYAIETSNVLLQSL